MRRRSRSFLVLLLAAAVALLASACHAAPGVVISTFAGTGALGYSGDNGPAAAAELNFPAGLAVDGAGNVYVGDSENNVVRKIDTTGTITTVAGTGTQGFSGDGSSATTAELDRPTGLVLDGVGNLYIADRWNRRVRMVDTSGTITTVAGSGDPGSGGDGGSAIAAELTEPVGLALDGAGNLYISDVTANVVRMVDTSGTITTVAGGGATDPSNGGSATAAQLTSPGEVEVDGSGNLYIPDFSNRVMKVDTAGVISVVAGTGAPGFSGDGGAATAAELDGPTGVVADADGSIYIAEFRNQRVRRVQSVTGTIETVAGTGVEGDAGDGGDPLAAELGNPFCLALDSAGNLYVSQYGFHSIRKLTFGGTIIGSVTEDGSGTPLEGVTVYLYDAADTTTPIGVDTTHSDGHYGFSVQPGEYRVEFVPDATHVGEWFDDVDQAGSSSTIVIANTDPNPPQDRQVADAGLAVAP